MTMSRNIYTISVIRKQSMSTPFIKEGLLKKSKGNIPEKSCLKFVKSNHL